VQRRRPQGSDFLVPTNLAPPQFFANVAWIPATNRFVAVWADINPLDQYFDAYAKVYTADGTVVVADYEVSAATLGNQWDAAVAAGGSSGEFIVWDDEAPPFVETGQWQSPSGANFLVYASDPPGAPELWGPAVAVSGVGSGTAFVVWGNTDWGNVQPGIPTYGVPRLLARRFPAPGNGGPVFQVDTGEARPGAPDVASDRAGNVMVVWTDRPTPFDPHDRVMARRYDTSGNAIAAPFRVDTPGSEVGTPSIASATTGEIMVVWESGTNPEIRGRRYASTGMALGPDFPVASRASGEDSVRRPDVGVDAAGNFLVAWDRRSGHPGDDTGIFARGYAGSGGSTDADGDGHCANDDDCPTVYNPDQRDADGSGGGDVCDGCPAGTGCATADSGASTIGSGGGTLAVGNVTVDVPAGSVGGDTSFSVTALAGSEYGLGLTTPVVDVVQLGPEGVPVRAAGDGHVRVARRERRRRRGRRLTPHPRAQPRRLSEWCSRHARVRSRRLSAGNL